MTLGLMENELLARFRLRKLSAVFLFCSMAVSAYAAPKHFAVRIMAALDPIGILKGIDKEYSAAYGFTPGMEALVIISPSVQAGIGFQYQFPRTGFDNFETEVLFHFYPLYGTARFRIVTMEKFQIVLSGKLGYAFFREYTGIWNPIGGSSTTNYTDYNGGGLFVSGALAAVYNLKETASWGLDLTLETGFELAFAKDTSPMESYGMTYTGMNVALGLGFRF